MNNYTIDELEPGMSESFTVTVSEQMLDDFARLSGDINPLHNSKEFAVSRGYPGRVAFGMLCASFYSTLAGVYLPGKNCLLHEVKTKFRKPVFIGDTLTVSGKLTDVSPALSRITIKATITNQNGEKVNSADIEAGVLRE